MKQQLAQLTIFDQMEWTNHKRKTIPKWEPTTHFTDSPSIHSEATSRIIIPRDQILAFISGQADRLSRIYEDFEPVQKLSTQTRSPFHC